VLWCYGTIRLRKKAVHDAQMSESVLFLARGSETRTLSECAVVVQTIVAPEVLTPKQVL
jgi:hypothetical protein